VSLASSWLDLVVGIDLHMEIVPTPVPTPVPFPHPHCSVIWDPVGYIVGEITGMAFAALVGAPIEPAGPVLVGGSMGTVVGDAAAMPIKHIFLPPGVSFVLGITPSDAQLLFGSQTVTFRGASAVRAGEIAFPCSEPLPLPTGQVVPIPKGPYTTMVGGPPSFAIGNALQLLGGKALRSKWMAGKLHGVIDKVIPDKLPRLRRLAHKSACFFTGHPVNVTTGGVTTSAVDFELPGPIPLRLERDYDTNWFDRDGPLGRGWSHSLDTRVWIEPGRVVWLTEDGRELEFNTRAFHEGVMRDGDSAFHPVDRVTLRARGHHRWEITDADGLTRVFGPVAGEPHDDERRGTSRLVTLRDREGHEVSFRYDDHARLIEIEDSAGRTVGLENDAAGRLRRIWLPASDGQGMRQHAEFRYDDAGNLVEAKDAAGKPTRFEYDRHLLVRETNRNGLSFYFQYDGYGRYARCTRTWGDGGIYDHVIGYDREGRKTIVTNSLGEATAYAMNPLGLVTKIVRPDGTELGFEYDVTTRLLAETDELGQTTRYAYDERGNRTQIVGPDEATTQIVYDAHDQPTEVTDALGAKWAWRYDSRGRVIARTNPLGQTTTYDYDDGQLRSITDAVGSRTQLAWSRAHELTAVTTADGAVTKLSHDALGRLVRREDAAGNVQRRHYDAMGRVTQVDEPDGNVRQLQYDAMGNVVRARDRQRDVTLSYSGLDKLASRTIAGTEVKFQYDTEGQLVAVTNERGRTHRLERDVAGQIQAEVAFDGSTKTFERDAAGHLTRIVRPGGQRPSTLQYDVAGRVTRVDHWDGTFEAYGYDAAGRLVTADNAEAQLRFERDALGRVIKETAGDHWVERKYDHHGARVGTRSSLGAELSIERNVMGDVVAVAQTGGKVHAWRATMSRDVMGHEVDRVLPGAGRSYWWRDKLGRPTQHWVGRDKTAARTRKYAWEVDHRLRSITEEGAGTTTLEHDARGALVQTTGPDGEVDGRFPDEVGDLFSSLARADREYGPVGEIRKRSTKDGVVTYRYDADGNLHERTDADGGVWRYHWSGPGHLTQVDRPDGSAVAMRYDALGRRIGNNHLGRETRFVWDGDVVLHQWDEAAEVPKRRLSPPETARLAVLEATKARLQAAMPESWESRWHEMLDADEGFERLHAELRHREAHGEPEPPVVDPTVVTWLHEPGGFAPLARLTAADAISVVCDHVGAPLVTLAADGRTLASFTLDSYGNATTTGEHAELIPHRFPGQWADAETGLHYNRFRHYDPGSGQYLSRDPIGLRGGLQPMAYVDDPSGWVDPLGLAGKPAAGAGCDGEASRGSGRPDFVVGSDGTAVPVSQSRMRAGLDRAGVPSRPATGSSEAGRIHTVDTPHGPVDVRTMEGGAHHPRRAVTTRAGTNDPVRITGERFRGNESRPTRRAGSHLEQDP
jgi:RHS repeat-associated protein